MKCQNNIMSDECIIQQEKYDNFANVGTIAKLRTIAKYIDSWIYIMPHNNFKKYDGVIFLDCMCNSGLYIKKDSLEIIEGTAYLTIEKMMKASKSKKNSKVNHFVFMNDLDKNRISCVECINSYHKEKINPDDNKYKKKFNVGYADVFAKESAKNIIDFAKKHNYHILVVCDPYGVDIPWVEMTPFFESNQCDIIISHFLGNDTIRNIARDDLKDEQKEKYLSFYGEEFEIMQKDVIDLGIKEKREYFRDKLDIIIKSLTNKKSIKYPIMNSKNVLMYDILCVSHSIAARNLFKSCSYSANKKSINENEKRNEKIENGQIQLFSFDTLYNDYDEEKEAALFYGPDHYATLLITEFIGKVVSGDDLKEYIRNHDVIPLDGAIDDIQKKLKSRKVVITERNGKYDFREAF